MRITVFGLGYVGAVSAGCLARRRHQVIGVDGNPRKLDRIRLLGATVRQEGHDFDAAREASVAYSKRTGQPIVPSGQSAAARRG